ncbi:MAG: hypothetical protein EOO05_16225 [Chitinophagaceae bacterium]|nr:MAG: hypothetical protein EOO05_16225 [Chitinophagaceae bacterium]
MDVKLTLSLDQDVIEAAKKYARTQNTSLSNLVEQFLARVTLENDVDVPEISPLVQSLSGVISTEVLQREQPGYGDYLAKKYN